MPKKILVAGVLGLISGYLSTVISDQGLWTVTGKDFFFFFMPGLFFAAFTGLLFIVILHRTKYLNYLFWLVASILAYNVAWWSSFYLVGVSGNVFMSSGAGQFGVFYNNPGAYGAFFIGGFLGTFICMLGLKFFVEKFSTKEVLLLAFFGGLLGMAGVIHNAQARFGASDFVPLFLIWQSGMLMLIIWKAISHARGLQNI